MNKKFFSALPMFLWDTVDNGGGASVTDKEAKVDNKSTDEPVETTKSSALATRDELFEENTRLKTRIGELNRENSTHRQAAKISDDDKAELAAYRAFGLKPDDLKKALDEGTTAKAKNAETDRLGELEKAAKAKGWKSALLKRLAPNLPTFSKEVDVKGEDGKFTKERQWFFKDGDKETEMGAYFADDEETLTLLKSDEADTSVRTKRQDGVTKHIGTPKGGGAPAKTPFEERMEAKRKAKEEKKNPLMNSA